MNKIKSILFVCTGNSCRSIMAEGLMRDALKKLGKEGIGASSAGVRAIDGFRPTRETIEAMKREGIDVSCLLSRALTDKMIRDSGLILVMTAHHMDEIIRRLPEAASKTHMLKQYARRDDSAACEDLDISDPIGSSVEIYERTLNEIKGEVNRIAQEL
jgi:Protein-tyrosine-phosphatase